MQSATVYVYRRRHNDRSISWGMEMYGDKFVNVKLTSKQANRMIKELCLKPSSYHSNATVTIYE